MRVAQAGMLRTCRVNGAYLILSECYNGDIAGDGRSFRLEPIGLLSSECALSLYNTKRFNLGTYGCAPSIMMDRGRFTLCVSGTWHDRASEAQFR